MLDQNSGESFSVSPPSSYDDRLGDMKSFVTFDVSKKALTGRLVKNKIFGIFTLGFYRFWGKTHIRRQLWQGVRIGADRLQYHGTAKELFIGFLIAMVILSILFTVVGLLLVLLVTAAPQLSVVDQFINFMLLFGFWQFARYRLWRFRLSRTSFRTIRFFLQGSALTYTGKTLFWALLSILTLGWAYPKLRAAQLDYQLNNTFFGDQSIRFSGEGADFYNIYWPVILAGQCIIGVAIAYLVLSTGLDVTNLQQIEAAVTSEVQLGLLAGGVLVFLLFVAAKVKELQYVAGKIRFAGASFKSNLPIGRTLLIFAIMTVVSAVGFVAIILLFTFASKIDPVFLAVLILGVFFAIYFVIDIIKYLFLIVPLMKAICGSLSTDNITVFEEVAASSHQSPKYGEGLADALDVGAF